MDEKALIKMLMLKRHYVPGAREEELQKRFGEQFRELIEKARKTLKPMGLEIVDIRHRGIKRYFLRFKDSDEKISVPRIDDLSVIVACIAYLSSKKDGAKFGELEEILREKFSRRRIEIAINRGLREGYLEEKGEYFFVGWRGLAEIDMEKLHEMLG